MGLKEKQSWYYKSVIERSKSETKTKKLKKQKNKNKH